MQNDKNLNLDSLFSNLSFGGTISYHNWIELADNFSFSNFLGKTVFLEPRIHDFLLKIQNDTEHFGRNLLTLESITNIAFKEDKDSLFDVTSELLAFDMNINNLRFLLRFEEDITNISAFHKYKAVLSPWKNVKTFLGSIVFNYSQFDRSILTEFLEKILKLNIKYNLNIQILPSTDIETLRKNDLNVYETLLFRSKFVHLKRMSTTENQIAKVLFVLIQIIQEIENLSWIIFSKSQGLEKEIISDRINIL